MPRAQILKNRKKKSSHKKDNNAKLHFIEQGLYDRLSDNAQKNKRTIPAEIMLHLENTYK